MVGYPTDPLLCETKVYRICCSDHLRTHGLVDSISDDSVFYGSGVIKGEEVLTPIVKRSLK